MNNKKIACFLLLLCLVIMSTGCASIFNSPAQSVRIDSDPQNAKYKIVDEHGVEVAQGTTPDTVVLRSSSAPFQRARYYVDYEHEDYPAKTSSLVSKFSSWYIVDLVFYLPGWIGALIIDPYTGTMYTLPAESRVVLTGQSSSSEADGQSQ